MSKIVFLGDTLLNDEPLGIQRFAYEILKQLDQMQLDYDCELLVPASYDCKITFNQIKIVKYGDIRTGFLWRQIDYPKYVRSNHSIGVDLTLGLALQGSDVVCLHDCIYENYSQDFIGIKEKIKRFSYLIRARRAIKKSKVIITVSQTSKIELMQHYKIPSEKIKVIYNAWQHYERVMPDDKILDRFHLTKGNYCFSLGSGLPHKNFKWVIAAAIKNPQYQFVVTGTNRLSIYAKELNCNNVSNVTFTGFLTDGEVKALMENCKVFLHPSLYEGFGIPPLEALCCGADIAISNKSCLPEIYQNSAHYFNPVDYENIDINALLVSPTDQKENILRMYSWKTSANQINNIILEL